MTNKYNTTSHMMMLSTAHHIIFSTMTSGILNQNQTAHWGLEKISSNLIKLSRDCSAVAKKAKFKQEYLDLIKTQVELENTNLLYKLSQWAKHLAQLG